MPGDSTTHNPLLPREKLQKSGVKALSDAELLAILLGSGSRSLPVQQLAQGLLQRLDGLRGLFRASWNRLLAEPGLGPAKAAQLIAVIELARRHLYEVVERSTPLQNPGDTRRYLRSVLRDKPHEVFACLFLDTRHRVIAFEELFQGTIDGATVYPRVVAERALRLGAAALIVAHNHPSGVCEPSMADQAITRRLEDALDLLDIRLLDHFVVGDGQPVSMAARGLV